VPVLFHGWWGTVTQRGRVARRLTCPRTAVRKLFANFAVSTTVLRDRNPSVEA
jgi:hypothetical protein